jgi:hypothetical protein
MNDQEIQTLTSQLLEQIERQSEIIAYLLGKNERLRSQLRDIEQSSHAKLRQQKLLERARRVGPMWETTGMPDGY